jgi:hypothetical protein
MVLRDIPPIDFLVRFFFCFGITSIPLHRSQTFVKEDIRLQEVEALLPQLEYYYIPCKASVYLHPPLTVDRCITIAKHILRPHSMTLIASSITIHGTKKTQYHIHLNTLNTSDTFVSFT